VKVKVRESITTLDRSLRRISLI